MHLQVFQNPVFGTLFVLFEDGKPLFRATQVATILGYTNPRDAIQRHCRCVVKRDVPHPQSPSKTIEISVIPEGDLYRLITHSKLPSAQRFETWVFDEVLPSIRKHGLYAADELLNNPDLLIQVATQLKEERLRRKEAEAKVTELNNTIEVQTQEIRQLQPRAQYCDEVLDSTTLITTTTIAKDFGKSAKWLNKFLEMQGIQYQSKDGQWHLRWRYAGEGLTQSKTAVYRSGYEVHTKQYTCWTEKGRKFLYGVLMSEGYMPNSMRDNKRS